MTATLDAGSPAVDARAKALLLCGFALEKKAQDLVLLEVGQLTTIADFFLICSGRSDRHVQSIAEGIREDARPHKLRPISSEGVSLGQWVLMDFSDVLVHVFYEPVRRFYDLDGLWGSAPAVELPEPHATLAAQFRADPSEAEPWSERAGGGNTGSAGGPAGLVD